MGSLILAAAFGYLLGSFPTAYLVVRWKSKVDIRSAGTGNVGTLNSFVVTNSKRIAFLVLCGDVVKGVLGVVLSNHLFGEGFPIAAVAGVSVVVGHNFPVWLGLRGGRGLAAAAGVMLALGWVFLALWLAIWLGGYLLLREINPASALTCILVLGIFHMVPPSVLEPYIPHGATISSFRVFGSAIIIVILSKHVQPVLEYIGNLRKREERQ